jgi:hypothetical protein
VDDAVTGAMQDEGEPRRGAGGDAAFRLPPPISCASPSRSPHSPYPFLACTLASCRDTTGPGSDDVLVCHFPTPGAGGALAHIVSSELAEHVGRGDYVARLVVEKQHATGDSVHFARITDAIAAASGSRAAHAELSAASCRIEIVVGAGTFQGSSGATSDPTLERFPLVLDVPDVTLCGSFVMQIDQTNRATGLGTGGGCCGAGSSTRPPTPLPAGVVSQWSRVRYMTGTTRWRAHDAVARE